MHARVCVSMCVCLKFGAQPPPQGQPSQEGGGRGGGCKVSALRIRFQNGRRASPRRERLVAAAGSDHHVSVLLEDDVGAVVEVEHRDGVELRGGAAGFGNRVRVDEVNLEGGFFFLKKKVNASR